MLSKAVAESKRLVSRKHEVSPQVNFTFMLLTDEEN